MRRAILLLTVFSLFYLPRAAAEETVHASKPKPLNNSIANKEVLGWTVNQTSKFFGDTRIFVSNHGIRIVRPRDGMIILAAPPHWTVYSFKASSRKIFKTKLDEFGAVTRSFLKPMTLPKLERIQGSERKLLNTTVVTFKSLPIPYDIDSQHHSVRGSKQTFDVSLIAASDLKLPLEAVSIVSKYYGIPEVNGLPIQFLYSKDVEGDQLNLVTKSLQVDKISVDALQPPPGYTQVNDIRSVNLDDESTKLIEDFAGSLGKRN